MKRGVPVLLAAFLVGIALAVFLALPRPTLPESDGLDDGPDPHPAVRHVIVRVVAKDLVVRELIAGRLSLPDAAARFGWLNSLPPAALPRPSQHLAALAGLPTGVQYVEGEALALQVVAWISRMVPTGEPAGARAEALRQFREARTEGRLARLPEVGEAERARLHALAKTEANASHPIQPED